MKYSGVRCPNMNHGRMNAPVKFCPNCGETVNKLAQSRCDHAAHRKNRLTFCCECGKKLSSVP